MDMKKRRVIKTLMDFMFLMSKFAQSFSVVNSVYSV